MFIPMKKASPFSQVLRPTDHILRSTNMKAIIFNQYGGPEQLVEAEVPDPVPSPGEMLIRVRAVGVNPADGKWRSGMFQAIAPVPLPHVGGYDIAGEVIGGGDLPIGTRVVAMVDPLRSGAYAELAVADPSRVARLPDEIDFATGASLPTPGLTGAQLIEDDLGVKAGQRVLITGAVGAVGRIAVHAAKQLGATVIAAVRDGAAEHAFQLGADEVIILGSANYDGPAFDCILDTIGGDLVSPLCCKVKADGLICTAATTPIPPDGVPVAIVFAGVRPDSDRLARVVSWVANGQILVPIADRLPLAQARTAQARVDAGSTGGKIILVP
jgi:NADPH:quinone reductase-like Zn-dependent oxidoreductase